MLITLDAISNTTSRMGSSSGSMAPAADMLTLISEPTKSMPRIASETPQNQRVQGDFLGVHGSPQDRDMYLFSWAEVYAQFQYLDAFGVKSCFFGHTHFPGIYNEDGLCSGDEKGRFLLNDNNRFFINPGSVGQPRDNDPRAAYLLYDTDASLIHFIRLEYDISKAADKILRSGLPKFLADRLMLGR